MMKMIKKYPVRDYLSVETSISHTRHAVGMTPLSDASLRDATVVGRSFSTERYIPTECSLITANALKGQNISAQGNALWYKMPIPTIALKGRNRDIALSGRKQSQKSSKSHGHLVETQLIASLQYTNNKQLKIK
jgi:hypothetical protein